MEIGTSNGVVNYGGSMGWLMMARMGSASGGSMGLVDGSVGFFGDLTQEIDCFEVVVVFWISCLVAWVAKASTNNRFGLVKSFLADRKLHMFGWLWSSKHDELCGPSDRIIH